MDTNLKDNKQSDKDSKIKPKENEDIIKNETVKFHKSIIFLKSYSSFDFRNFFLLIYVNFMKILCFGKT